MQTTAIPARRSLEGIESFAMRVDAPPRALRLRHAATAVGVHARVVIFACVVIGFGAAGAGAGLVMRTADARVAEPAAATPAAPPPAASPGWIEIKRPLPLFELAGSEFGRLPLTYRARRREGGSERQDLLTYGGFGEASPFLALSILRKDGVSRQGDFFVDMARLAAEQTLSVTRTALPTLLQTRFGDFAIADVTLARGPRAVACLGFRLDTSEGPASPIEMGGFACGTPGHGMDRALLGCVLDRIDLLSAGDDEALRDVFVAAERRRGQQCAGSRLLAAGTRGLWLDADATPPALRRLTGARSHTP